MADEATEHFERAVELQPANPTSYVLAAAMHNGQRDWQAAVAAVRRGQAVLAESTPGDGAPRGPLAAALAAQLAAAENGMREL